MMLPAATCLVVRVGWRFSLALVLGVGLFRPVAGSAAGAGPDRIRMVVDQAILPVMQANAIPGMAVGVLIDGRRVVFDYGVASRRLAQPVTQDTLFEVGSISKLFTATLAGYAQARGAVSLAGMAGAYLPSLRGTAFDHVRLLDLGTYTPGGMPLQVPDGIADEAQLIAYFRSWQPTYAPGTMRTYSNPAIGLLGLVTANAMHADFSALVQERMFPALGMAHSFIEVPPAQLRNYAQGHTKAGAPVRLAMGVTGPQAYGVRMTAGDLLRFLAINMDPVGLDPLWQRAVVATHTGYHRLQAGGMVQDLVWEQYDLPVTAAALQAGNGAELVLKPNPATALVPPLPPKTDVLLDKTGATNGFAAYLALIPAARTGIVLLANRDYPISAEVAAAYAILSGLQVAGVTQSP